MQPGRMKRRNALWMLIVVLCLSAAVITGGLLTLRGRHGQQSRPVPSTAPAPAPSTTVTPIITPTPTPAPTPAPAAAVPPSSLRVNIIDVGQGDAIFVQFPDQRNMLVDAGDTEHGPAVVAYLRKRNISRIHLLVVTHPHADHIGGMAEVLAAFPVEQVWDCGYHQGSRLQQRFLQTIKEKGIRYGTPRAGDTRDFGAVRVAVLAPVQAITGSESDANNNCLVLRVVQGDVSILLTGDMEAEERRTVASWPLSTVLKVAHHGSRNGTDLAFLRAVRPGLAVISCGRDNDYGHPHAETRSALSTAGIAVKTTARDGSIELTFDGKTYSATTRGNTTGTPVVAAPATTPPANEGFIGNLRSKVFHRPTCEGLPAERNRQAIATRDHAIAAGYHPCKRCQP